MALRAAHRCLEALSALEPAETSGTSSSGGSGALTALGRAMSAFPISPRHARMLLEVVAWQRQSAASASPHIEENEGGGDADPRGGKRKKKDKKGKDQGSQGLALPYAVALAAALSVESPFIHVDNVVSQKTVFLTP